MSWKLISLVSNLDCAWRTKMNFSSFIQLSIALSCIFIVFFTWTKIVTEFFLNFGLWTYIFPDYISCSYLVDKAALWHAYVKLSSLQKGAASEKCALPTERLTELLTFMSLHMLHCTSVLHRFFSWLSEKRSLALCFDKQNIEKKLSRTGRKVLAKLR